VIPIYVGYDPRESVAYHTFCNSVIKRSSKPVQFIPLAKNLLNFDGRRDGSNDFIYSRFLVPYLNGYNGWALFADGDMVCLEDISKLFDLADPFGKAVMVVKHDYKTKQKVKYLGNVNSDYPRKNWSSVILWNCKHFSNLKLTPEFVSKKDGAYLHRFQWLRDDEIGELPKEWNWLAEEYPHNDKAKLIHYTLGTPCFKDYENCDHSAQWHEERALMDYPQNKQDPRLLDAYLNQSECEG